MKDKIVLVTGGSGGIGLETARGIARTGATIIIVGRSEERGQKAVEDLESSTDNPNIVFMSADLSSQADIVRLTQDFKTRFNRLDVLINNVGGLYGERQETVDSVEAIFAMNHVNPYLLTKQLLPLVQASVPARVINITTGVHRFVKLDLDNLQSERQFDAPIAVFARAKLANLMASYHLARELDGTGVTVNIADPGGASTDMTEGMTANYFPMPVRLLFPLWKVIRSFMGVETAAHSSVYLAISPDVEGVTGKYFNPAGNAVKSSRQSYDEAYQQQIVQITDNLVSQVALDVRSEESRDKHSLPA